MVLSGTYIFSRVRVNIGLAMAIFWCTSWITVEDSEFPAGRRPGFNLEDSGRGKPFDLLGSVIYACALVAVMYGFSIVPESAAIILIAAGFVIRIVFVLYEMRIPVPVLDLHLLTKKPCLCVLKSCCPHQLQCDLYSNLSFKS